MTCLWLYGSAISLLYLVDWKRVSAVDSGSIPGGKDNRTGRLECVRSSCRSGAAAWMYVDQVSRFAASVESRRVTSELRPDAMNATEVWTTRGWVQPSSMRVAILLLRYKLINFGIAFRKFNALLIRKTPEKTLCFETLAFITRFEILEILGALGALSGRFLFRE